MLNGYCTYVLKLASVLANLCEFEVAFDTVEILSSVADGARGGGVGGGGGGGGIVVLHASRIGCLLETNEGRVKKDFS